MRRIFILSLALVVAILTGCGQAVETDRQAAIEEPYVVTVYKSPT